MLIPINSDAPLYHWPIATVGLIVLTSAVSIGMWELDTETFDKWVLVYGHGIHPLQWVSSVFMHQDFGHLIGNMIFLLPFGLLVEGKIGWWKFLLLYLGIGISQCAFEQMLMLGHKPDAELLAALEELGIHAPPGSLGASSAIFGIVVVTVFWAPKNDMTCLLLMFPLVRTLDIPITVLVGFYIGWEAFMFMLDGFSVQTAALHLMGAFMGGIAGFLFLKFRWVDCEGWDLISVMTGNHAAAKATRERVSGPDLKKKAAEEKVERENVQNRKQAAVLHIQKLLQEGQPVPAFALYQKMTAAAGDLGLSAPVLMQLGKGLLDAKQTSDCITAWLAYLKVETGPALKLRLKLAQLLLDYAARPASALEVLAGIPTGPLPPDLAKYQQQLTAKANAQLEDAELELE